MCKSRLWTDKTVPRGSSLRLSACPFLSRHCTETARPRALPKAGGGGRRWGNQPGGGALEGRVLGVSGVGPSSPGGRRQAETRWGGPGASLLHELPSRRGGAHFRVGPRGVRRPCQGPGGPQVSRGGRLPRPAPAEERSAGWAADPGGGRAPWGRARAALLTRAPGAAGSGFGPIRDPRTAGRPPRGFVVSQPLTSRLASWESLERFSE